MRAFTIIAVTMGSFAFAGPGQAEQPAAEPPPVLPIVELDRIAALGKAVAAIPYESDNKYFYAERAAALHKTAQTLEGGRVEFFANVMRVRDNEVFVEIEPAGKTRLVPMHAALPVFGNLRTVSYHGVPSAHRFHIFSAPIGLRIGSEIKFELAKTLRRRDVLVLRGTIESMPVWIESVFEPTTVALISDWKIVDVNPQAGY